MRPISTTIPKTYVSLDANAYKKNIREFKKILPKGTQLMCVVKANAYGHGLAETITILKDNTHVDWFAVFDFTDALYIRKYTKKKIFVLCNVPAALWNEALAHNITITISTEKGLRELALYSKKNKLQWHMKIDTGLGRQGFTRVQLPMVIELIKTANMYPQGIYSHFSGVESKEFNQYSKKQYDELLLWEQALKEIGCLPTVHIAGTAGNIRNREYSRNIARFGIGLYGLPPSPELARTVRTKNFYTPVLSFKTYISEVKNIKKGAYVAYDCTYRAKKDMAIAILPVGYFDGLPRTLSNRGKVLVGGHFAPIIGRIMMNMCIIDVSPIPKIPEGTEVTIIGPVGKKTLSAEMVAEDAGTINYELVTRINPLVERRIVGLLKKQK